MPNLPLLRKLRSLRNHPPELFVALESYLAYNKEYTSDNPIEHEFYRELRLLRASDDELEQGACKFVFTNKAPLTQQVSPAGGNYPEVTVLAQNKVDAVYIYHKLVGKEYREVAPCHTICACERWVFMSTATPEGCFLGCQSQNFVCFDVFSNKLLTLVNRTA